jgi:hypothetical protein
MSWRADVVSPQEMNVVPALCTVEQLQNIFSVVNACDECVAALAGHATVHAVAVIAVPSVRFAC